MKKILFILMAITLLFSSTAFAGSFNSGSTGELGAFNPTTNTEVQLPADGILNYTTVNIPAGVTVTFKKNAANTPVYILATGNVTIAGTISVNGGNGSSIFPGKGGPGGHDGGLGSAGNSSGGKGLGAGGGNPGIANIIGATGAGGGGGFGSSGNKGGESAPGYAGNGGGTYGNDRIIPTTGGSGGGGGNNYCSGGGGSGGGAIMIASSNTVNITGTITASGGNGASGGGGGGSGGAIKLMADTISGNGTITAIGGTTSFAWSCTAGGGGNGRIRLEANTVIRTAQTTPAYTYSHPSTVFVANIPNLKISSVAGVNVPESPSGAYGSSDITLPSNTINPVSVTVTATNIPVGTTVTVASIPEYGTHATATATLSGTSASSTATVNIAISTQYQCILTATTTFTIQMAMYWDGEKIEKVRVASTMGRNSNVVYITESGKEIPAEKLLASLR